MKVLDEILVNRINQLRKKLQLHNYSCFSSNPLFILQCIFSLNLCSFFSLLFPPNFLTVIALADILILSWHYKTSWLFSHKFLQRKCVLDEEKILEGGNHPHFKMKGAKQWEKSYSVTIFVGPSIVHQTPESPSIPLELPDSHLSGLICVKAPENKDWFFDLGG